jgi:exodeoxyribonuclease V beta subunit
VHAYLGARDEVIAGGGSRVPLEQNFRATLALVRAHNQIFDQAADEPIFTGAIEYTAVECGRPDRALTDGEGRAVAPVSVLRFARGELSAEALGPWIAAEVRTVTDPARPWRFDGRALDASDVFVLTRNGREGRAVGAALRAAGVPHSFYKEEGLFQSDEAKDVRALLSAIDDPSDRASRLAAWLTPFFGLPLSEIERARDLPASHPLVARLHTWKALADGRAFGRLFESIVRHTGVLRREIFFADGERELTNYLHILEFLLERARDGHPTLSELVHGLTGLIDKTRAPLDVVDGNAQRIESERRAVQIMTIHKAKGLEAPIVFVAGGFTPSPIDEVRVYHHQGRRLAWVGALSPDVESLVKDEESEEDQRLMYVALTRAMGRLVLPCLVEAEPTANGKRDAGDAKPMRGPYDRVNRRVVERLQASERGDASAGELFAVVDVAGPPPGVIESPPSGPEWTPPVALLRDEDRSARYTALRDRHAGAIVTSYTRLRGERAGSRPVWSDGPEDRRAQKAAESDDVADSAETRLRGARASGVFLHEILERVPLASFAAPGGLSEWRVRAEVSALFDEAIAVHRIEPAQRAHAEQLVWAAYTTPVVLPGADAREGARLDTGFAGADRVVREMDFVYPIPQADHPTLAESPRPVSSGKGAGYIRGSLDLAFEHRGLTYFIDWKSDSLPSYSAEALGHRVATHYEDQAMLYALAVVRLLGLRSADDHRARFGGLLYCFLRGVDGSGQGMWSLRPSWDILLGWDESLRARRHWGGAS